ncbi:MAG: hypothetical protein WKG07_02030 [Hymenobacter sp.]
MKPSADDLALLARQLDAGTLQTDVARIYPWSKPDKLGPTAPAIGRQATRSLPLKRSQWLTRFTAKLYWR